MAGNWIKMRHDLLDAPEVRRLARATQLDRDQVYGKLFRLWSWADRHGNNGRLDAELEDVDDQVGHVGFGAALVSVGWLVSTDGGIVIPRWERHFSDSAKVRALGQNRAEKHRNGRRNAPSVTHPPDGVTQGALPEEIREENPPPPPREAAPPEAAAAALRAAWAAAAKAGHVAPYRARGMPDGLAARLADDGWLDDALRAIEHLPRCRYFSTPATLIQLCGKGFVGRVLAGQYDDAKPARSSTGAPAGDPPKRKLPEDFTAAVRATQAALDAKRKEAAAC
jgi:hypothetical protein